MDLPSEQCVCLSGKAIVKLFHYNQQFIIYCGRWPHLGLQSVQASRCRGAASSPASGPIPAWANSRAPCTT